MSRKMFSLKNECANEIDRKVYKSSILNCNKLKEVEQKMMSYQVSNEKLT
jgi:hypothetical protein